MSFGGGGGLVHNTFQWCDSCLPELSDDSGPHGNRNICVYVPQHLLPEHNNFQASAACLGAKLGFECQCW